MKSVLGWWVQDREVSLLSKARQPALSSTERLPEPKSLHTQQTLLDQTSTKSTNLELQYHATSGGPPLPTDGMQTLGFPSNAYNCSHATQLGPPPDTAAGLTLSCKGCRKPPQRRESCWAACSKKRCPRSELEPLLEARSKLRGPGWELTVRGFVAR